LTHSSGKKRGEKGEKEAFPSLEIEGGHQEHRWIFHVRKIFLPWGKGLSTRARSEKKKGGSYLSDKGGRSPPSLMSEMKGKSFFFPSPALL